MTKRLLFVGMLLMVLTACKSNGKQEAVEIIDLPRMETTAKVSQAMDGYFKAHQLRICFTGSPFGNRHRQQCTLCCFYQKDCQRIAF